MRLNLDCIRDILLCLEENTGYNKVAIFLDTTTPDEMNDFLGNDCTVKPYQQILLVNYDSSELMYHLNYCVKADLAELHNSSSQMDLIFADLTPKGHEFIENIRSDTVFKGVKSIAEKVGSSSLNAITQIAANTIAQLIKSQFGLS